MKRTILLVAAFVGAALVTAACGGTGSYGRYGTANPAGGAPAAPGTATVSVANSSRGQILVDGSGRTLYLFEADKAVSSSCYDACIGVWPAVLTTSPPAAGAGVKASLLGTTKRKDGTLEVVYNGHPLYYFSGDKMAGDVTGQGLSSFGAAWYVVSPGGSKIDTDSVPSVGGY
jgi:predicted lipoprotein with Yx(FWY)xxD motif